MEVFFKNTTSGLLTSESHIVRLTKETIDGSQFYVLKDDVGCLICYPMGQYKLHMVNE